MANLLDGVSSLEHEIGAYWAKHNVNNLFYY